MLGLVGGSPSFGHSLLIFLIDDDKNKRKESSNPNGMDVNHMIYENIVAEQVNVLFYILFCKMTGCLITVN